MLFAANGRPLFAATGRPLLVTAATTGSSSSSSGSGAFSGPFPSDILGLSGWWDAGALDGMADAQGDALTAWGSTAGSLPDKSGGAAMLPYHWFTGSGSPAALIATPRLNGLLGGVGAPVSPASYAPTLDPDTGLQLTNLATGPNLAWTRMIVWSRPNRRQGTLQVNANPVALLRSNGVTLVSLSSTGATLTLFPASVALTLSTAMTRRHSHALVLRNTPGVGVDVWLDGTRVATAIANPLPNGAAGQFVFGHEMNLQGGAQLWFHEMAGWERALSSADITTLIACGGRWTLGTRRGSSLLVMGQSNAGYFWLSGAAQIMANGLSWYLGTLAGNIIVAASGSFINPPRYTQISGHPISNSTQPLFPPGAGNGTFLVNPGDGSDPSTWALGPDGLAVQAYLSGAAMVPTAEDIADIAAIVWPWTEQDSTAPYTQKALYTGSVKQLAALTRGMLGRSAAQLPLLMWNAIPYETDTGVQMVRESVADIAADSTQNLSVFAAQTADSIPLNATYDAVNGTWSGGDPEHRDETDEIAFGHRGAHVAARAALAASLGDTLTAIASGMPLAGPGIAHAYRQSSTEIVVTVVHDQGSDIRLPLQAANGAGWAAMDGGTVAAPGTIIAAIAAARIDATHLLVTLASTITSPSPDVQLFYPWGSTQIGRGDAVTDNFSSIGWPAGWDMGGDLGAAWTTDFPLQATSYGIPLSDSTG
ncbi:hypothetical protein [Acidisoma sp. S159]|uniref:hypothetical protein n=1 Tax=Acidisoma sp. S159 TaxID=1747225 RepID=UPI0020B1215E|nr:hypothetical protein [Acidisoma sp. S159]